MANARARAGSKRYRESARSWRTDASTVASRPAHDGRAFIAATSSGEINTISRMNVVRAPSRSPARSRLHPRQRRRVVLERAPEARRAPAWRSSPVWNAASKAQTAPNEWPSTNTGPGLRGDDGDHVFDFLVETIRQRVSAGAMRPSIHRADAERGREQGETGASSDGDRRCRRAR